MADKPEEKKKETIQATILSYETTHVAIAKIGGKTFRVNIPANSNHPPVGDAEIKDKWRRREFTKEEQAEIEAKKAAATKGTETTKEK